jgi:tRNA A58 N-methylase Trm61
MSINHFSNVVVFADDTSDLITDKNYDECKQNINLTLLYISQWFDANQLALNIAKTNIIQFTPIDSAYAHLKTEYKDTTIEDAAGTKFLGMYIGKYIKWECHIDQILLQLRAACFVIRKLFHILNADTLSTVYFACFHQLLNMVSSFGEILLMHIKFLNCKTG